MLAHSTNLYMALSQTLRSAREVWERDYPTASERYHFQRSPQGNLVSEHSAEATVVDRHPVRLTGCPESII